MSRVSAFALLVLLLPTATARPQDISERPEGVVCRAPECDLRRSLPRNLDMPFERHAAYIERVQNIPASALDRALGAVPFDLWLTSTLQAYRWARADESFAFWGLSYCDSPLSAFPLAGEPDLCVEVSVPIVGDREVRAHIRVAAVDAQSQFPGWRDIEPEVYDIYIVRLQGDSEIDSLDVPSLSAIHACLVKRFDDWPTIDLKPKVTWAPISPKPGTVVRFTITVANAGGRDADRALVRIYIAIPLNNEDQKELRRDWWPRIPAGKTVSFDISAKLGRGDATIVVNADAVGDKGEREVNGEDNEVIALIPFPR